MTPEELNAGFREHVYGNLSRQAAAVRELVLGDDPEEVQKSVLEHGTFLAEKGLLDPSEAPRVNKVFFALYKNTELEEFAMMWADAVYKDSRAADTVKAMNFRPETVSAEDFDYVYDRYLAPDTYVVPYLEILLRDKDFREAMELEDDITVAEYRQRATEYGAVVTNYEEFVNSAHQYSYFGPFVCGPTVCVSPIAVAVTFT